MANSQCSISHQIDIKYVSTVRAPNTHLGILHKVYEIQNLPLNRFKNTGENLYIKVMGKTGNIA